MDNGASSYRRFLKGDASAFDAIIGEYKNGLIFFIDRYVHNITEAEDIAIDVFTDLIAHPHRYNFKCTLKTYLFMLGRCRALNYLKHQKKFASAELTDDIADRKTLEETVLSEERKRAVHAALERLPEAMRTAVYLVYFEGLTYKETARVMKKSQKQIDNLIYRAKQTLRTILVGEGDLF